MKPFAIFAVGTGLIPRRVFTAWAALEDVFGPPPLLPPTTQARQTTCGLKVNFEVLAEMEVRQRFCLSYPAATVSDLGVTLAMRGNPFGHFKPLLLSYCHCVSMSYFERGDYFELEYRKAHLHVVLEIPGHNSDSWPQKRYATGPTQLQTREPTHSRVAASSSDTLQVYMDSHGCSRWVAEALRTLDNRDLVDGLADVSALSLVANEWQRSREWTAAAPMEADPATSYWLRKKLSEVQAKPNAEMFHDLEQLQAIVQDRVERAWCGPLPLEPVREWNAVYPEVDSVMSNKK